MKIKSEKTAFAHIAVSRKILKSDDGVLKKSIADAMELMSKKAKGCKIYITYAPKDSEYVGYDRGLKAMVYVQKRKRVPRNKKKFSSTVVGKGKERIINTNKILCANTVIKAFENALKSCRADFKNNLHKKFGNPAERAMNDYAHHLRKLEIRRNYEKSVESYEGFDYSI